MNSCMKEIVELAFNASRGIVKTRIKPKAIIIEEEIRTNHLVTGSKLITNK